MITVLAPARQVNTLLTGADLVTGLHTYGPLTLTTLATPGPQGPAGVPGPAGGSLYVHTQSAAASEWVIQHDLGAWPLIDLFDTAGNRIIGQILHINLNQSRSYFNVSVAGSARCL